MDPGHMGAVAIAVHALVATAPAANVVYHGPSSYFGAADSPFADLVGAGSILLDEFERFGAEPNPSPVVGVTANCGGPIGGPPSVDEDDGVIDGDGFGVSMSTGGGNRCGTFFDLVFSPHFETHRPNIIGFVVVENFGYSISASVFDVDGNEISDGRMFELPEVDMGRDSSPHRFIGFESDVEIARLITSGASRIDHLQYGYVVPEPGIGVMLWFGLGEFTLRRWCGG